jgi:hypothetical protein
MKIWPTGNCVQLRMRAEQGNEFRSPTRPRILQIGLGGIGVGTEYTGKQPGQI